MGVSVLAASGDDVSIIYLLFIIMFYLKKKMKGAVGTSRCTGNRFTFNPGYPGM